MRGIARTHGIAQDSRFSLLFQKVVKIIIYVLSIYGFHLNRFICMFFLAVSVLSIFFMFISLDSSFSYSFFSLDGSLCGKNKVNKFKLFFHGVVLILTSVQIVKKTNNCFPGEGGNYKGSGNFSVTDKINEDCFCFHFVGMTTVGAARMHMCIQHRGLNSTRVGILVSACVFKSRPLGVSCDISTRYL